MSIIPGRKELEAMKRVDIQRLCKDYGVKANLKTEALIDLLVDASRPAPPRVAHQLPQRVPSTSRRRSIRTEERSRGMSSSSIIIHDTDDEEETVQPEEPAVTPVAAILSSPTGTRSRKAKETQKRLGVGKPVVAGGAGPRAITKSRSLSRGSRPIKGSRSMKPVEETIIEEDVESMLPTLEDHNGQPEHIDEPPRSEAQPEATVVPDSLAILELIDKRVAEALRPLHEQMRSMKSELDLIRAQTAEATALEKKMQLLNAEVAELRGNMKGALESHPSAMPVLESQQQDSPTNNTRFLKEPITQSHEELPRTIEITAASHNSNLPSIRQGSVDDPGIRSHPGIAPSMLGKRQRDSIVSVTTGILNTVDEDNTGMVEFEEVTKPLKKRAKLDVEEEHSVVERIYSPEASGSHLRESTIEAGTLPQKHGGPSFSVFTGESPPSFVDPPPPTTHLPDIFAPFTSAMVPTTSTANAIENQTTFGFSLLPPSTTPPGVYSDEFPMTIQHFPYPEPPTSPSPSRPKRHRSTSGNDSDTGGVNPSALYNSPSSTDGPKDQARITSNDVAAALGLKAVRTTEPASTIGAGPMKKTMYGTELDGDTRFGDFGVEGVASGFWAGGRF